MAGQRRAEPRSRSGRRGVKGLFGRVGLTATLLGVGLLVSPSCPRAQPPNVADIHGRFEPRVLAQVEGRFGRIFVVEEGGKRALRFGSPQAEDQSLYDPRWPHREPLPYGRLALRALAWVEAPRRVLVVGLGGGSLLRHLRRLVPTATLEAVEIDPQVEPLARRWMGLHLAGRVKVHIEDGRAFLARTEARYDLLFLDAFDAHDYPAHLGTRELFALAASRLTPRGVIIANLSPNHMERRRDLVATFLHALPGSVCRKATPDTNTLVFGGPAVNLRPKALSGRAFPRLARRKGWSAGFFGSGGAPCAFSFAGARILRDSDGIRRPGHLGVEPRGTGYGLRGGLPSGPRGSE